MITSILVGLTGIGIGNKLPKLMPEQAPPLTAWDIACPVDSSMQPMDAVTVRNCWQNSPPEVLLANAEALGDTFPVARDALIAQAYRKLAASQVPAPTPEPVAVAPEPEPGPATVAETPKAKAAEPAVSEDAIRLATVKLAMEKAQTNGSGKVVDITTEEILTKARNGSLAESA